MGGESLKVLCESGMGWCMGMQLVLLVHAMGF